MLIENRDSLNITLSREQAEDLGGTLVLLSELSGVPLAELQATLERHRRDPPFRPLVLIRDVAFDVVAAVAAHARELPGIYVEQLPVRFYPAGEVAAHILGYGIRERASRRGCRQVRHRTHLQSVVDGPRRRAAGRGRQHRS